MVSMILCLVVTLLVPSFVIAFRLEQCDANAAFNPPTSLRSRGNIYVLQNNMNLKSGGVQTLHDLHATLIRAGFSSKMHYVNPIYAEPFSRNLSLSSWQEEVMADGLKKEDVLVIPEIMNVDTHDTSIGTLIDFLERHQGLVVRLILGKHDNVHNTHINRILHITSSNYLRKQHLAPGPVLDVPLHKSIFEAAAAESSWRTFKEDGVNFSLCDGDDGEPIILMDDDCIYSETLLNLLLKETAKLRGLPPPYPTTRKFSGLSRNETIALFKRAKIFVDLYLPGKEFSFVSITFPTLSQLMHLFPLLYRSNFEAALFGVLPLITSLMNGQDHDDFPPHLFHRTDDGEVDYSIKSNLTRELELSSLCGHALPPSSVALFSPFVSNHGNAIDSDTHICYHVFLAFEIIELLRNYDTLYEEAEELRARIRMMPSSFFDASVALFGGRHTQIVTAASTMEEFQWILPFIVSALCTNALVPIYVYLDPTAAVGSKSDSIFWLKSRLGWIAWETFDRLGLFNRVRFVMWNPRTSENGSVRKWPTSRLIALGAPPPLGEKPFSLQVPVQSLIVGDAALACGVRALESEKAAVVQLVVSSDSDKSAPFDPAFKVVALVSETEVLNSAMETLLSNTQKKEEDLWGKAAFSLADSKTCVGALGFTAGCQVAGVALARPLLAGSATVLGLGAGSASGPFSSRTVPQALSSHPLWRAMYPLFSDYIQKRINN